MSQAASAKYGVPCEKCGAEEDAACRTPSGRVTDAHKARQIAYYESRRWRRRFPSWSTEPAR